jgi:hypothetical protein
VGAVPGCLGVVEAGGELGQGGRGMVEALGGPVEAGLGSGAVEQEGVAGRAFPGAGDDHERGRSPQAAAEVLEGGGGAGQAAGPAGDGRRLPRRAGHGPAGAGDAGGGRCGIGGSSGRGATRDAGRQARPDRTSCSRARDPGQPAVHTPTPGPARPGQRSEELAGALR